MGEHLKIPCGFKIQKPLEPNKTRSCTVYRM